MEEWGMVEWRERYGLLTSWNPGVFDDVECGHCGHRGWYHDWETGPRELWWGGQCDKINCECPGYLPFKLEQEKLGGT